MSDRTLLLTDVVDSTALSERLGDVRMAEVWTAHDRIARDLLMTHGGREIDKTDGFLLLFDAPADAVAYALAYHRAIGALDPPLRARAGLHVGPVVLRHNPPDDVARGAKPVEVEGIAKPTAARVMAAAAAGQTLLTETARAQLAPDRWRLVSHGHWRMKGLLHPIELFEVGGDDTPFVPPPDGAKVYRVVRAGELWIPAREVRHTLPAERDTFVGRRSDLAALAERLDQGSRLVSVLGLGGTGKTRLVVRYGWSWLGDWPGGVYFVDLSEARDADGVVAAVAAALGVPLSKGEAVEQLGHAIAGRGRCLLLLDNFEQVARHASGTVGPWLDRAAEAVFVVTTREVLGVSGEVALTLPPLDELDAVRLFDLRARAAHREYVPEPEAVTALVRLLDLLPLAIELAAARVRVMGPAKLLERMGERFRLLVAPGGRRDRQATLRATIDWSWELLSEDEQRGLAQLSVFEGGFTLEAVEQVLELGGAWAADIVQGLVDKSLVRRVADDRFDLLVSVQEYAAMRLGANDGAAARDRHLAWCAAFAQDAAPRGDAIQRLEPERSNLEAALRHALERGDAERAADVWLDALDALLQSLGPRPRRVVLGERLATMTGLGPHRARLVRVRLAGAIGLTGHVSEALVRLDALVEEARREGDGPVERGARSSRSRLQLVGSAAAAVDDLVWTVASARAAHDRSLASHLSSLGLLYVRLGRLDDARQVLLESIDLAAADGQLAIEGASLCNLALIDIDAMRYEEGERLLERALDRVRRARNVEFEANILGNLALGLVNRGRREEGLARMREVLRIHRELGDRVRLCDTLHNVAAAEALSARHAASAVSYEELRVLGRETGNVAAQSDGIRGVALNRTYASGRVVQALTELRHAQALLGTTTPHMGRVSCGQAIATCLELLGRIDEAREELAVARELAVGANHHRLAAACDATRARLDPDPVAAERSLLEVLDRVRAGGVLPQVAAVCGALAERALDRGDLEAAGRWVDEGLAVATDPDALWEERAAVLARSGDREGAVADLDRVVAKLRGIGHVPRLAAALATRWRVLGDPVALDELRTLLERTDLPADAPLRRLG